MTFFLSQIGTRPKCTPVEIKVAGADAARFLYASADGAVRAVRAAGRAAVPPARARLPARPACHVLCAAGRPAPTLPAAPPLLSSQL
ncbi:unnamed protein product [Colias eurytheme]|nr:unnamed protein product [Colias eurytheme]